MSEPLFHLDGDTFAATASSTGPWSPDALHGGPVSALLAHHLEAEPGGDDLFPARLTVELWRPVSHEPLRVDVDVVRPGRKVRVVEARLVKAADDTVVARGTLQQIRRAPVELPSDHRTLDPIDPPPAQPDDLPAPDPDVRSNDPPAFHNLVVEHRAANSFFDHLGPEFDWIRVTVDLAPGIPLSPFMRVAAAADFGNGVSATLPVTRYGFVNPDLTVVLDDLPTDEWVALDARTRVSDHGVGYAESALYGRQGRIGRSIQSLLIDG